MSSTPTKRPWRLWINQLAAVWLPIAIVSVFLTFAGFFGDRDWLFEVADVFRVQYAIVLFAGVAIFLAARRKIVMAIALAAFVANCYVLAPCFLPSKSPAADGHKIRLLQINLNSKNRQSNAVVDLIRKLSPDVISFEEVDPFWQTELEKRLSAYPIRKIVVQQDNFGIAVFSRLPLAEVKVAELGLARVPAISALVNVESQTFRLLAVHVLPPRSVSYFNDRNKEYDEIVNLLSTETRPVVVAGDLNSPPWSIYFKKLCIDGSFVDSGNGHGVQPTWPTNCVLLLIPIDHLLTRGSISVSNRFVTDRIGSDHYPLCSDLQMDGK